jgi:hypothetical protein
MTAADTPDEDLVLRVLLPLPLAGAYDYRADPEAGLQPGDFVRVPLGSRVALGVVWDGDPEISARQGCRRRRGASWTGSRSTRCRRPARCCAWR